MHRMAHRFPKGLYIRLKTSACLLDDVFRQDIATYFFFPSGLCFSFHLPFFCEYLEASGLVLIDFRLFPGLDPIVLNN